MLKHYVYIHPAFHPNGAINFKNMERNSFIFLIEYGFYHIGLKKKLIITQKTAQKSSTSNQNETTNVDTHK